MFGRFGTAPFGSSEFLAILSSIVPGKYIVVLGDSSNHGGSVITTNQDGTLKVRGAVVAVEGALHSCPIDGHGVTPITAVTVKSYHNSKLILTIGAVAGCGAKLIPSDRKVYIE